VNKTIRSTGRNAAWERRVLDCILMDPTLWPMISTLPVDLFLLPENRMVFATMQKLVANNQPINIENVADLMDHERFLGFATDEPLIPRSRPKEIENYISRFRNEAAVRRVAHEMNRMVTAIADGEGISLEEIRKLAESLPAPGPNGVVDASLEVIMAAAIEQETIEWLWPSRIPANKLTVLAGPPDVGKSTVTCDIVARATTERAWPDSEITHEPVDVLMLVDEDGLEDTVVPRLVAAAANLNRIHFARRTIIRNNAKTIERRIALDTDLALIESELVKNKDIKIVVLDPFGSYIGKAKKNSEENMRDMLVGTKELAERCGVAVLSVDHFNKNYDQSAIHRLSGAGALTAVPRAAWAFVKDADDAEKLTRLMLNIKLNVVEESKKAGLKYRFKIMPVIIKGKVTDQPCIEWLGASSGDIDETLESQADPNERRAAKAKRFLLQFLAAGPQSSDDIYTAAGAKNISRGALWEAKKELNIPAIRVSERWWWELRGQP
jgi:RecA-family ATPase